MARSGERTRSISKIQTDPEGGTVILQGVRTVGKADQAHREACWLHRNGRAGRDGGRRAPEDPAQFGHVVFAER
jgi:hypothetical protein